MKKKEDSTFYEDVEKTVDRSIPYLVVILFFIIIGELNFDLHHYEPYIKALDTWIILIFVLDLYFKYQKVQDNWTFVKRYWLDIIAVFPFYLFFRVFSEAAAILQLGDLFAEGQLIFHEGLEVEKIAAKEIEATRMARARFIPRFLRALQRSPRLFKARVFFQWHKYKSKNKNIKTHSKKSR